MTEPVSIDVVVCTYDNVASLELVLGALARQAVPADVDWGVLVVDNNCTDGTPALLERLRAEGALPLRVVLETVQGLTPARRRGVAETSRDWVAFVDDDCVVSEDWVAQAAAVARERPAAGGFGGVVALEWERDPPGYVERHPWAYAHQDHGPLAKPVPSLAGAGMVLRRAALVRSGWTEQQLLADRVGHRLISGGDVEIALRVAAEHELWFDPRLRLRHLIPARRTTPRHLAALTYGLGTSKLLGDSMLWRGSYRGWVARSLRDSLPFARMALAALRHGQLVDAAADASFLRGWLAGIWRLRRADPAWRRALLGAAAPARPG
jgi:glycosyltransferase involved in cell wall biosynthesis